MLIFSGTSQSSPQRVWCCTATTPPSSTRSKVLPTGKHGSTTPVVTLSAQSPPSTQSALLSVVSFLEDPLLIILAVKSVWVLAACLLSSPLSCNASLRIIAWDVSWPEGASSVSDRVLH